MSKDKLVVGSDLTPDWLEKRLNIMGELDKQLIRGLQEPGKGLTLDHLQATVEHRDPFRDVVDVFDQLQGQHSFYHQFFGLDPDFSSVRIPDRRPGFDRLLVVAQGLTPNRVYEACKKHGIKCWHTDDLDATLDWDKEERNPKDDGPYAIWVRDRQEADEELQNLSANQIKKKGLTTETLTERLVHGLMYWDETGNQLDVTNITLCAGSRSQGGRVPGILWRDGELYVHWYFPDYSSRYLRSRVAVS